jgi:hypothetical protein
MVEISTDIVTESENSGSGRRRRRKRRRRRRFVVPRPCATLSHLVKMPEIWTKCHTDEFKLCMSPCSPRLASAWHLQFFIFKF